MDFDDCGLCIECNAVFDENSDEWYMDDEELSEGVCNDCGPC